MEKVLPDVLCMPVKEAADFLNGFAGENGCADTSTNKDRMVSFTVGLDGKVPLPGWIIAVADEMLAGRPLGGRISSVDGRNINLDRVSSLPTLSGERLILNLPVGAEGRTIAAVSGKTVTVTTAYSETPVAEGAVWAVYDFALQQFRVTGIKEGDDGIVRYYRCRA
ncbi:hypothetical protein [Serratia proteamaculans]